MRFGSGATERLFADPVDVLLGRPEEEGVMEEQDVSFNCVGPRALGRQLAQQPADWLEQDKPVPVRGRRAVLLQGLGDSGKPGRCDFPEG